MNNEVIGRRVSSLRMRQHLSTTDLARKVDISQAQISRLENGKQGFRSATLSKIAEALGVSVVALIMDDEQFSPIDKLIQALCKEIDYAHWDNDQKDMLRKALKWAQKARDGTL
ncbi:hypothetical protein LCGC14_0164780 [marine sediment metagenome]|uniref:HTH cro/C1-type domain-containing protein n=1 Tax=marine sediment metagenome TaxID=412755 RepID=A0A0F9UYN8_9ZZZZ